MARKARVEAGVQVIGNASKLAEDVAASLRKDVEAKIGEAYGAAKRLLDEAFSRVQNKVREEITAKLRAAQEQLESYKASKEVELRKKLMRIKSEYAESVLREVLAKLRAEVAEEEYKAYMRRILESALERAARYTNEVVIVPVESDRGVVAEVLRTLERVPVKATISREAAKGLGGFIVRSADGRLSLDYRLEAILQPLIEEVKTVILRVLFPS